MSKKAVVSSSVDLISSHSFKSAFHLIGFHSANSHISKNDVFLNIKRDLSLCCLCRKISITT